MIKLPPNQRRNVTIYRLDGTVIATRRELSDRVIKYTRVPGSANLYRGANGEIVSGPPVEAKRRGLSSNSISTECSSGTNTGAFRRVCSTAGWAGEGGAWAPFPCSAAYMASQTDTPYLLTGGWSSSGEAVDAGVQYSPVNDWYTPFMRLQGGSQMDAQGSIPCWNGLYYTGPNSGQVNSNIGWGQTSLIVISSTQLSQNVDQCQADPNNTAIEDCYSWNQILDVPHNAGWTTKGTGVVWKRATAIAQSTGCPCDDGSTFGYTGNVKMFGTGSHLIFVSRYTPTAS
ncbi:MAG TPA: hypothetical protein VNF68_03815 [Candidatus Baltobacteraceae bacterium]|nr:hypothetical protein [Candidatus Baltobacteraceae bacterium]